MWIKRSKFGKTEKSHFFTKKVTKESYKKVTKERNLLKKVTNS